jgi:DNA-binding transcriptional LysR family regulator
MRVSRLDIDQLRTFVAAVDGGSITASAACIRRSQSAASEQIRKLEETLSTPLLVRGKGGVKTTSAGERLLGHARRLLAMHDAVVDDMKGVLLDGDIHIAMTDYFRPHTVATLLKTLKIRHPRLRLRVSTRKSALIEEEVGSAYDLGLSMRLVAPDVPRSRDGVVLARETLSWVAAEDFEHDELESFPLLALPESCAMHRLATGLLEQSRVPFHVSHTTSGVGGLQSAVLAGLGIAALNASAIPAGACAYVKSTKLPPLPAAEFTLSPPRPGEPAVVAEVRTMLASALNDR